MLKKRSYNIDRKVADETLKNVFAACEQQPNTKPLEVIRVRSIASDVVVKIGFVASIILLVLVLTMPLAFGLPSGDKDKHKSNISIENHYIDTELRCFVMNLKGENIDYDGIYARKDDGTIVVPFRIDEENKTVMIPFNGGNINIFIPNGDGTYIQAVLSK